MRHWNRTLRLVFLKTLPSQIIDYSHFAAQRNLALDGEAENEPCRHQLRDSINGLWIKWRMQREDQTLFGVRDDKRGSIFEGNALHLLSNEMVKDPSRGHRLIDVVVCSFVM